LGHRLTGLGMRATRPANTERKKRNPGASSCRGPGSTNRDWEGMGGMPLPGGCFINFVFALPSWSHSRDEHRQSISHVHGHRHWHVKSISQGARHILNLVLIGQPGAFSASDAASASEQEQERATCNLEQHAWHATLSLFVRNVVFVWQHVSNRIHGTFTAPCACALAPLSRVAV
jgi:hypothetical protein